MGSTKVRTVPGLLARAVLQGEPAQPVSLAQSRPPAHHTPAFLPASSMDVGLGGGGQVEVEHGTHVVEVDAPGHACLGIGGPVGTTTLSPALPSCCSPAQPTGKVSNKAFTEPQDWATGDSLNFTTVPGAEGSGAAKTLPGPQLWGNGGTPCPTGWSENHHRQRLGAPVSPQNYPAPGHSCTPPAGWAVSPRDRVSTTPAALPLVLPTELVCPSTLSILRSRAGLRGLCQQPGLAPHSGTLVSVSPRRIEGQKQGLTCPPWVLYPDACL